VKLLLTSSGISNPSIEDALVGLLGKPIAESSVCVPETRIGLINDPAWSSGHLSGPPIGERPIARLLEWSSFRTLMRASGTREDASQTVGYAASWYSWISPPSRSRRRTRLRSVTSAIARSPGGRLSGGRCPRARCGRCSL
jgi:hypothetical protein